MPDTALDPAFALAQEKVLAQRALLDQADDATLKLLFSEARSHNRWSDRAVSDDTLRRLYDLAKFAPTAANLQPARYFHVRSAEAKARLEPHVNEGNRAKTLSAPVTTIVAYDPAYFEQAPKIFPIRPGIADVFRGAPAMAEAEGRSSAYLGTAFFILAARALGLDAGPLAGFDAAGIDAEFFGDSGWKSLLIVNLGYGDTAGVAPRLPRLAFDEANQLV